MSSLGWVVAFSISQVNPATWIGTFRNQTSDRALAETKISAVLSFDQKNMDWKTPPNDMGLPGHRGVVGDGLVIENCNTEWLLLWWQRRQKNAELDSFIHQSLVAQEARLEVEGLKRHIGCLLGLAVGDAMGAPVEHQARGTFEVKSMIEVVGKRRPLSGMYTDDTSLALCLAYSLMKCRRFDIRHLADCLAYYYTCGVFHPTATCYGIGRTTRKAIQKYMKTRDPYAGPTGSETAGNGSLMRLAPIPMFFASASPDTAAKYSGLSSRITHQAVEAVDCCRVYGCLIHGALNGVSKEDLLRSDIWTRGSVTPEWLPSPEYWKENPLCESVVAVVSGSYKDKPASEIRASAYVMHSLEAALWAFYATTTFAEGMLRVINLGEDTDTNAAIYGQLAGAYYGEASIPTEWLAHLTDRAHFYTYAYMLWSLAPLHSLTPKM